ncbi:MAG TPA: hypothetical protein VGM08_03720 [Candidatus Saccharimonadales bacterium]|jgi:uncharacterized membrane protein
MKEVKLENIGPLQLLAVAFTEPTFSGEVRDELRKLRDQELVRVVDGVVVRKDNSGKVAAVEESDLSAEENMQYGEVIGSLLGLGAGSLDAAVQSSAEVAEAFHQRYEYGLDREDIEDLADQMPAGTAVLFLLIEHRWLMPVRNAMRGEGGVLLAQDFLSPELLMTLGRQGAAAGKGPMHAAS